MMEFSVDPVLGFEGAFESKLLVCPHHCQTPRGSSSTDGLSCIFLPLFAADLKEGIPFNLGLLEHEYLRGFYFQEVFYCLGFLRIP